VHSPDSEECGGADAVGLGGAPGGVVLEVLQDFLVGLMDLKPTIICGRLAPRVVSRPAEAQMSGPVVYRLPLAITRRPWRQSRTLPHLTSVWGASFSGSKTIAVRP